MARDSPCPQRTVLGQDFIKRKIPSLVRYALVFGTARQECCQLWLSGAINHKLYLELCWWCSVTQSRLTLWDPKDCSAPGFPVLRYLLEFAQIHVH